MGSGRCGELAIANFSSALVLRCSCEILTSRKSVRYEQINAMLLNEFLKEHRKGEEQDRKIQQQQTTIAELRSEIQALAARVNEQASELWKVNAQLQITNAAAQAIASNPH